MSSAKTKARQCAVQALYQWQMTGTDLSTIARQFAEDQRLKNAQKSYFTDLFHGIPKDLDKIDFAMKDFIDRAVNDIDPVERAILRIGVYELLHKPETPYRVIINEGVELAKYFGADGSHRYVNGVLDKVAQIQRKLEIEAKLKKS
ncbi:transcription antitermination factor NusB [methanotrophic endosymbiont of Bathymodiolus puteoserpentis (Logatchev)]|jgi:N utilization substance protein B|uniref:transcription antitermination factor NusB n=1 Tax=methanotrophic endosymbiont of Bathymodiolus puteoserpentis (Logatchev) TaxID=343235 RepID=UPI00086F20EF|nr:transcription antitermination factor NusB [methanotrophic endosymbiont of Bathymodiolus puteoserpentis (Logatchev)]SCN47116.1 Transcription termination protein NusB [methanotrophic endosymbiont of Bathymodiolus azoricus (Menez Gwen)]SHE23732.1 Transcription termination protein NusB [methanotrophic endosymbiont of Bathymodiolus puteoserpentis (Logatchev)]